MRHSEPVTSGYTEHNQVSWPSSVIGEHTIGPDLDSFCCHEDVSSLINAIKLRTRLASFQYRLGASVQNWLNHLINITNVPQ